MKTKYLQLQSNQQVKDYEVTEKTFNGKKHLVVPVVMIVEGVLNGSHGPLLHKAEDFGKIPESWNGIPVVINHPEEEGHSISANSPEVIERQSVGVIYNARMDSNRLLAECWLDSEKLGKVSSETLIAVNDGQTIEISVGVYTEDEAVTDGDWNGIKYNSIAKNHRPDHLALLPGGVGACSVKDGCGIRANSENKKGGKSVDRLEAIQVLRDSGQYIHEIGANMAQGLKEKLDELYELVRSLNKPYDKQGLNGSYCYLEEAYDTYLIYSVEDGKDRKTFKQNYQFNVTTGQPEFVGDAVEVEKKIEYKELKTNVGLTRNNKNKSMADEKCTPCVAKKAAALIANKATKWGEADLEYLQTLEESVLDRMIPEVEVVEVEKVVANALSAEDQAALDFGKKMLAKKKKDMADGIQKNSAGTWTNDELLGMNESMLEKIYKSTVKAEVPVDFSLQANAVKIVDNAGAIAPLMPNV